MPERKLFVVAISGKMQSGKDTIGSYLVNKYKFKRIAFGDKLKEICMNYDNSTSEKRKQWNRSIAKDLYPEENIEKMSEIIDDLMQRIQPGLWTRLTYDECYKQKTDFSRNVMQQLGEGIRALKGDSSCWAKYLIRKCLTRSGRYVICDLRYKSEAFLVEQIDHSQIWRVKRPIEEESLFGSNHISEIDLDDYPFEVVLNNNSTIGELHRQVDKVVRPFLQGQKPFFADNSLY